MIAAMPPVFDRLTAYVLCPDALGIKAGGAQGEAWNQMLAFLETNIKRKSTLSSELAVTNYHAPFAWKYYAMLVYEHAFGTASHRH